MHSLQAGLGIAPFNIPGWEQTQDETPLVSRCLMLDDGQTRWLHPAIEGRRTENEGVRIRIAELCGSCESGAN